MPIIRANGLTVDFSDSGTGLAVVLIHSSVSGNRQWRSLTAVLAPNFRVLAVNLRGTARPLSSPARERTRWTTTSQW